MKRLAATLLCLLLGSCSTSLSRQNPLDPSPFRPVPGGAGVFETFEHGPAATVWYGSAGPPDSIALGLSNQEFYSGNHSLKYTVSVNSPTTYPSLWGSVGHDLNSNFGVVDATGMGQLTLWVKASSAFNLFVIIFETGTGGTSCAESGTGKAWKLAQDVPYSAAWQKVSFSLASFLPHNKNLCVTAGAMDKNIFKTLEIDFAPVGVNFPLNASIEIDDIVFEP